MIKAPDVTLLYVIVAFLASYAILKRFLFRPLGAILEEREAEAAAAAKIHAESLAELERTVAEAEQKLSLARREALKDRETLRAEGQAHLDRRLAETRRAAHDSIERASGEIGESSKRTAAEIPLRARSLARELAEKILGRKLAA
jgi:F-type H+-transporting ATPase subunit b